MPIAQQLLPEFDHGFATTRTFLTQVPNEHLDWKPHPKSSSLGALATHLARLSTWTPLTFDLTRLDLAATPPNKGPLSSTEEILSTFDENVAIARASLAKVPDEDFSVVWSLAHGDHVIVSMPRLPVFRSFILEHNVHHRAQLGMYLRLLDVPLPQAYGPTADNPM